ncbi:MAG: hypothetical protein WCD37_20305 [Chloroflexia bacterium]
MFKKHPYFWINIAVIFTLALVIRLAYWADARAYAVGADEPDYVVPAQQFAREGRYVDTYISRDRIWTRVPLTSIFFAGSFLFVPDPAAATAEGDDAALMEARYDALNIAQILVSLLTIGITMALAYRAFPRRPHAAALLAGYISALYPPLASSPAQRALSEPLSIAVIFAAILLLTYWAPESSWQRKLGIAALVGLLLGIGALVRSVAVAFLPFACLYFLWTHRAWTKDEGRKMTADGGRWTVDDSSAVLALSSKSSTTSNRQSAPDNPPPPTVYRPPSTVHHQPLSSVAVAILSCFAAIAPWTYYNYTQYNSFLLLETANTTAYWHYHNFRRENEDEVLRQYANPADRLSIIVSRGTANILEYPDQAIGTTIFSFFYAWHLELNSAVLVNSWDFTQRDPDVPDLIHADAAFLLLGLTGLAGLAGVGLRRPTGTAGRTLLGINLWLLTMLILGVVVPYDARYRLPAAPALIILASGLLVYANWRAVFHPRRAWGILRRRPVVALTTLLLSLWVLIGAYSPGIPPLLRSLYQGWRGDLSSSKADAIGRYQLAEQALPGFYWAYGKEAAARRALGDDDAARVLYGKVRDLNPDDPYGMLAFADLAARHPEWQLTSDERAWLSRDEWEWRGNPWNSFRASPTNDIDVGTGRDIPYLLGFHHPDREPSIDYRWSMGRSHLRIPLPLNSPETPRTAISLRMSAPAVGRADPMLVTITINGIPTTLNVPVGWADYTIRLPEPHPPVWAVESTLNITIESPIRDLSILQPNSPDKRKLGVGLDRVTLATANP